MPLTVSTNCPSCGGGLDYEEGTNAVHCSYCGSDHVVTGHGRVLSYFIPEKLTAGRAVALSLLKLKTEGRSGYKAREATLFFVPFYHFTAKSFFWEAQEIAVAEGTGGQQSGLSFGFGDVELSFKLSGGPGCGAPRLTEKRFELETKAIDRSLPAIDALGLGICSLGLRTEVVKLSLFERKKAAARGMIAPADLDCGRLMEEQFGYTGEKEVFARTVFAKAASIIYFPLWLVETVSRAGEGSFCVVDGLSEDVWSTFAPVDIIDRLLAPAKDGYEAAGLRPMKCPECGAALPVRPKDVVFFCKECSKAWYITGSDFTEVPFRVAGPVLKSPPPSDLLPFWVVRVRMRAGDRLLDTKRDLVEIAPGASIPKESDSEIPLRFFVPAFDMGNMRALSRIAQGLTRQQPVFQPSGSKEAGLPASGCAISPDDALTLAPLILFSLIPKGNKKALKFALDAQVEPVSAELVYIPFSRGRFELTDCLCGLSIPAAAVRE